MDSNYFIVKIKLTELNYGKIDLMHDNLNALLSNRPKYQSFLSEDIAIHLSSASLDLWEVLKMRSCQSFLYNSYLLSMARLKLCLIMEKIGHSLKESHYQFVSVIYDCLWKLNDILDNEIDYPEFG
jgi:hypothetical protein